MANSLNRQIRDAIRAAEAQGFRTKETRNGVFVYSKDRDGGAVLLHMTPSDTRGVRNAIARLRKIGVRL